MSSVVRGGIRLKRACIPFAGVTLVTAVKWGPERAGLSEPKEPDGQCLVGRLS
jgi:hypothetical protein